MVNSVVRLPAFFRLCILDVSDLSDVRTVRLLSWLMSFFSCKTDIGETASEQVVCYINSLAKHALGSSCHYMLLARLLNSCTLSICFHIGLWRSGARYVTDFIIHAICEIFCLQTMTWVCWWLPRSKQKTFCFQVASTYNSQCWHFHSCVFKGYE